MKPQDAWLATLGQLQIQLHRATYNSWIAGSEFVDYEDGVFTISVQNSYAKDWLEQRLYRLVQGSLSTIFGQEVQVRFTVQPQEPKRYAFKPLPDGLPGFEDWGKPSTPEDETPVSIYAPPVENAPPVYFDPGDHLNPDYTFDTFIVGTSNQLAHAAAFGIAQDDSPLYNPLLIHSNVGLGKTHLLQAIGHACRDASKTFRYIAAETFTNDLVRAIRTRQTDAFRAHYREVDVLLVDDVQFMCGKESTQEEFFHTFNALHNFNARIVLATDRKPEEMTDLSERLRSRFEWGLVVQIQPPDHTTRMAILQEKAAAQQMDLPTGIADLIAHRIRSSVRHLEGALNRILALHALTRQPLTPDYVDAVLRHEAAQESTKVTLRLDDILEATATYHQLSLDDLLGKDRSKYVATARHVAIYLAREEINASLQEIGRALGGRTHSTILNGYQKAAEQLEDDPDFRQMVNALRQKLYEQAAS